MSLETQIHVGIGCGWHQNARPVLGQVGGIFGLEVILLNSTEGLKQAVNNLHRLTAPGLSYK